MIGVEHGHVFLDVALTLQSLLPLEDGCRREMHRVGQFLRGEFGVFLQRFQYLQVGLV